jgi:hypothetical protein
MSRAMARGAHRAARHSAPGRFLDENQVALADARQEQMAAERGQGRAVRKDIGDAAESTDVSTRVMFNAKPAWPVHDDSPE